MPVGGYDPSDLDESLETNATEEDLERLLTDAERARYETGEAALFDLLSWDDIEDILARDEEFPTGAIDGTDPESDTY